MMEKLQITKVSATNLKKDGTPILSKYGKPSWRVGILTTQYGSVWLNGFLPYNPDKWEGSEQELEIGEDEYMGVKKKTFSLPGKESPLLSRIEALEVRVTKLENNARPN